MESNVIGAKQRSYRIEVFADRDLGDVVWDSGTVASEESTDIRYGGTGDATALRPESDYWWRVTVVDHRGAEAVSDVSTFSTGLMSGTIDAWEGAQWIGGEKTKLDAVSAQLFDINTRFTITSGDNISFVFGADHPRFTSEFRNVYGGPGGENLIRFQLDLSGVTDDAGNTGAVVNLYRKGYHGTDDVDGDPNVHPYKSVRLVDSATAARADGCTFLDLVWGQAPFDDHGRFVRTVRELTVEWHDDGLLTRQERQAILTAASRSDIVRGGGAGAG